MYYSNQCRCAQCGRWMKLIFEEEVNNTIIYYYECSNCGTEERRFVT